MDLSEVIATAKTVPQFIDLLAESLPVRTPKPEQTDRDIMFRAGRRSLVDDLLTIKARLEKETTT